MANSFNKRELEKKKEQKRKDKLKRKEERKSNAGGKSFDDMIAYVDEFGVISDTPPESDKKTEVDLEDIAVSTPRKEDVEEEPLTGRVDYFNTDKGFGFIKTPSGMEKFFFHINNAPPEIAEGNTVTFELERGEKGMNAVRIVII